MKIRIHDIFEESRANGPGIRFVIFFQGCLFKCEGCINPLTHDPDAGYTTTIKALLEMIKEKKDTIEGVTITGGEPFLQSKALYDLVLRIKKLGLNIIISTGYEFEELKEKVELFNSIARQCDIIISGRFHHEELLNKGLIGSANKEILFITKIYTEEQLLTTPKMELQISNNIIKASGTGIYDFFDWNLF